jgi:hypothetical protein
MQQQIRIIDASEKCRIRVSFIEYDLRRSTASLSNRRDHNAQRENKGSDLSSEMFRGHTGGFSLLRRGDDAAASQYPEARSSVQPFPVDPPSPLI